MLLYNNIYFYQLFRFDEIAGSEAQEIWAGIWSARGLAFLIQVSCWPLTGFTAQVALPLRVCSLSRPMWWKTFFHHIYEHSYIKMWSSEWFKLNYLFLNIVTENILVCESVSINVWSSSCCLQEMIRFISQY